MNGKGGRGWWIAGSFLVVSLLAGRLLPVVRWYFRHRAERVLEEAGRRGVRIPGFKLTRRRVLIQRLTHDPEILAAVEKHAGERGLSRAVVMARVERYAREIVPSFNAFLYFRVGMPLAARVSRALYDVRVVSDRGLSAVEDRKDASIVFVMNHRSNMDYVILAHLTADRVALSYAAGEWACVWPLGRLIGGMGAFFVRRGSNDDLYRRVLERFVQMAVEGGLTQVVFPEGGLSRDGKLGEPKIGLLDYMLRCFDAGADKDLVFVPVAVNYDWVLEDHALVQPGGPKAGIRGRGGLFTSTAASVARNLLRALRGGGIRLGDAAVGFGDPLSAREYARDRGVDFRALEREARIEEVKTFARLLMLDIREVMPSASVPAVARAVVGADEEGLSLAEIPERVRFAALPGNGVGTENLEAALRTLELRRLVVSERGRYRAAPGAEELLRYYAGSVFVP